MFQKIKACRTTRIIVLLFCLMIITAIAAPAAAMEKDTRKTIRVGWHEEPYFITDQYGRRSGYSYEYQRKVAAYTGWTMNMSRGHGLTFFKC